MNNTQTVASPRGCLARLVRRALIWMDGSDYRERYLRLAENFALSDMMGRQGCFKSARGKWHNCIITGLVACQHGGDYLIINYTTEDGSYIQGAEIPRSGFRPANDPVLAPADKKTPTTKHNV